METKNLLVVGLLMKNWLRTRKAGRGGVKAAAYEPLLLGDGRFPRRLDTAGMVPSSYWAYELSKAGAR